MKIKSGANLITKLTIISQTFHIYRRLFDGQAFFCIFAVTMKLHSISLINYKNLEEVHLPLSGKINCFTGKNGMGKTNMLDAIYYLSFGKSFTNQSDSMTVRHGSDFMMLQGSYSRKGENVEVSIGVQPGKRKTIKRNGKEYQRLSEHVGLLPAVMVSPLDWDLIRGGSEERRRFIDQIISQSDALYLQSVIAYNRALENRNHMLKNHISDRLLYESIEATMGNTSAVIYNGRKEWIKQFSKIFHDYYAQIAGDAEQVTLQYESQLHNQSLQEILDENRGKDMLLGFTSGGIHRDNLDLSVGGFSMRKIGSQGQCKTYTIALRLSQYEFLRQYSGVQPILLLDDIFDRLDGTRVENIINLVASSRFGQIFITDTDRTYVDQMIRRCGTDDYQLITVSNGSCAIEE